MAPFKVSYVVWIFKDMKYTYSTMTLSDEVKGHLPAGASTRGSNLTYNDCLASADSWNWKKKEEEKQIDQVGP